MPVESSVYKFSLLVSLHCYITSWEKLFKSQDNSSLVTISSILMTCMQEHPLIYYEKLEADHYWGLKGLPSVFENNLHDHLRRKSVDITLNSPKLNYVQLTWKK